MTRWASGWRSCSPRSSPGCCSTWRWRCECAGPLRRLGCVRRLRQAALRGA
nr:MAG TPA: hypothetical protein [Caudoviricetes sp.]